MKSIALIAGVLASVLAFASSGAAQPPLSYLGKPAASAPDSATGLIELGHGAYYEVGPGTEIPAWGRVKEVNESHLVLEQVRAEAEKRQMRQLNVMAYDVLEIHILRHDLRHPTSDRQPPRAHP
jgi:hypothetical protein